MGKKLEEYMSGLSESERVAIADRSEELVAEELTLRQLRRAMHQSQEKLGKVLQVNQAAVSKLERRSDMYVSTLRSYVEAMGGRLEIIANFPGRPAVKIKRFGDLADDSDRDTQA